MAGMQVVCSSDLKSLDSPTVEGLRLNLGCGERHFQGFINVDKYGCPDLKVDLETFPWPWEDDSTVEIRLIHVLEHLGQTTDVYLEIFKEMHRICRHGAHIMIKVPHYRHQFFFDDPTHVRAVTPLGLQLFSQAMNRDWIKAGYANSPLGIYLGIDFELKQTYYKPSPDWFRLHPEKPVDIDLLIRESNIYNNLVEELEMHLVAIKKLD